MNKFIKNFFLIILLLLAISPAFYTGYLTHKYSVNIPFWDQWDISPSIEKSYIGSLTIRDLFAQHNESRKFFPRLIFIELAHLTGWNVRYEMLVTFILAGLISLIIFQLSRMTTGWGSGKLLFYYFLANLLIFSPEQHENWLWGIQLVIFIPIVCILACILIGYSHRSPAFKTFLYVILATVSTYSFANGLLCWLIVFALLIFFRDKITARTPAQKSWPFIITGCFFLINLLVYFKGYHRPVWHPSMMTAFFHPFLAGSYFLVFLGSIFGLDVMWFCGVIGLGAVLLFAWLWRQNRGITEPAEISRSFGWFVLGIFIIISAFMAVLGRVGFLLLEQAMSSRYATLALYLFISLMYLLSIFLEKKSPRQKFFINTVCLTIFLVLIYSSYIKGTADIKANYLVRQKSQAALLFINICPRRDLLSKAVYSDFNFLYRQANKINALGLLNPPLIAANRIKTIADLETPVPAIGHFDSLVKRPDGLITVSGWAVLPGRERPADAILLTGQAAGTEPLIFHLIIPGTVRSDLLDLFGRDFYRYAGFAHSFPYAWPPPVKMKISAWAFDVETVRAYRLNNDFIIDTRGHIIKET